MSFHRCKSHFIPSLTVSFYLFVGETYRYRTRWPNGERRGEEEEEEEERRSRARVHQHGRIDPYVCGWMGAHKSERACTVAERHERDTRVATRRHTLPREIRVRGTGKRAAEGVPVLVARSVPSFSFSLSLFFIDVERTCERREDGGSNERLRFLLSTRVDLEQRPRRRRCRRRSTTTTV